MWQRCDSETGLGASPLRGSYDGRNDPLGSGARKSMAVGQPRNEMLSLLSRLTLPALSLLLLSCGNSPGGAPTDPDLPRAKTVVVLPSTKTVDALGATVQYTATVRDQMNREMPNAPVTWSSSSTDIAVVNSSGLAEAVGNGTASILAVASETAFGKGEMTVALRPFAITTSTLPPGVVGLAYDQTVEGEGVTMPQWSISAGALPPGLTLDAGTGALTGTPTTVGTSVFTVTLSGSGRTTSKELSIVVVSGEFGIGFDGDQFALIPSGSFQMGSLDGEDDERPVHTVNITRPFYLQKTEVTQHQWKSVMDSLPSGVAACGETCPIGRLSWNDVKAFIQTLNTMDPGKDYRLPTEAEWEYAARAGTTGDYGGTGNLDEMGWYLGNSEGRLQFVAQKEASAWGLFDMHGNVMEWVQDNYSATYYSESPQDDPTGPPSGSTRILRGGAAHLDAAEARSANRLYGSPWAVYTGSGFRLVRGQ